MVNARADGSDASAPLPLSLDVAGPPHSNHAFLFGTNDVWSSISAVAACRSSDGLDLDHSSLIGSDAAGSALTSVGLSSYTPLYETCLVTPPFFFTSSAFVSDVHELSSVDALHNDLRPSNLVNGGTVGSAVLGVQR